MAIDSKENNKKRAREDNSDDSEIYSKRPRVDSYDPIPNSGSDDSGVNSPNAKRIQDDLFNILDDSDEPAIQGLDSVIKSFEEEILVPVCDVETVVASGCSGGSQPDLGYLLEASDDELGLPPTFSSEEGKLSCADAGAETETSGSGATACFGEMLGFENEMPSYDSFDFGLGGVPVSSSYNDSGDFVAVGGLFDYSDESYVPADISGVQWQQPESLSAL